MNYEVTINDVEAMRVAYTRYKGDVLKANTVFPSVFKSIRGKTNGAPFFNIIQMNPETKIGEIELCVPTLETPSQSGIEVKELPHVKAVSVTHVGPYEQMDEAYRAITRYANDHKLELVPPFREVYIKGPGLVLKGNPKNYITEIIFPIKE
ncbi:MAG: GyrI-like domain-containing protein [Coprobacillaceae bacterium]